MRMQSKTGLESQDIGSIDPWFVDWILKFLLKKISLATYFLQHMIKNVFFFNILKQYG